MSREELLYRVEAGYSRETEKSKYKNIPIMIVRRVSNIPISKPGEFRETPETPQTFEIPARRKEPGK
jgi:hypothetical protein